MTQKLVAIRDSKAGFYDKPILVNSLGEAERSFHTLANDPTTAIGKYPEDFDLYYLGDFDNVEGKFQLLDTPNHMAKAVHLITRQNA